MEFIAPIMSIFVINLVLSGDNALLIALASRKLPEKQQKLAMFWGSFGAIALRIILTIIAVLLLKIPFLQFVGGILILWIAVKLLTNEEDGKEDESKTAGSLLEAIKIIIIADLVMSVDNVLAIAGASKGNIALLVFGLAVSIPLIILGAQLIVWLMNKFPVIIYIGAGILGWTGGEMILGDVRVSAFLNSYLHHNTILLLEWLLPTLLTLFVILFGYWLNARQKDGKQTQKEESTVH